VLEGISDEEYERVRDTVTTDEDCRSIRSIATHVVRSGYGYAGMLRDAWERPRTGALIEPMAHVRANDEVETMLRYMVETLDGKWDLSEEDSNAMRIAARWGPVYDFEQLFEHAIVHVLRHRRQIERFLGR
jgi:hypothetical protein